MSLSPSNSQFPTSGREDFLHKNSAQTEALWALRRLSSSRVVSWRTTRDLSGVVAGRVLRRLGTAGCGSGKVSGVGSRDTELGWPRRLSFAGVVRVDLEAECFARVEGHKDTELFSRDLRSCSRPRALR